MGTQPDQFIDYEGLYNLRELGGYPTTDMRVTRHGLLFRSEAFFRLNEEAQHALFDQLKLTTIIDLRSDQERRDQGFLDDVGGVELLHFPLLDVSIDSGLNRNDPNYLPQVYAAILDSQPASLANAVTTILDPDRWPLLFHCAAGKDRTGIVAMLVLAVAGVPDDLIAKDYSLTELALQRVLAANDPDVDPVNWSALPPAVLRSTPQTARATLDHLKASFGSVHAYLEQLGIAPALLRTFEHAFTAPTPESRPAMAQRQG
jgi:protein-tyrosine phosphatase